MRRREVVALLGIATARPLAAVAQQPLKLPTIEVVALLGIARRGHSRRSLPSLREERARGSLE